MSSPRVSVIMPTRNRAALLVRSVRSVLAQTFADLELIVVDDASTDGTPEALAGFNDPRLRVFRQATNGGAAAARNVGLRHARAPYLAFQDDDDFWLVGKLERQLAALEAAPEDAGLCVSGYIRVTPQGPRYFGGDALFSQLDFRGGTDLGGPDYSLIATPAWLVRRAALERAGGTFDERLRSWDDWELGLRLWKVCKFLHVPDPLYIQDHVSAGGMMWNERARGQDMKVIMQKHGELWAGNGRVLARHYHLIGKQEGNYGSAAQARTWLLQSLRHRPWWPKTWIALALTFFGDRGIAAVTQRWRQARSWLRSLARP